MEGKKNQLEQVSDILKSMFSAEELERMEAEYQKMLKEWEAKQKLKEEGTTKED